MSSRSSKRRQVGWAGSAGISHCDVRHCIACETVSDNKYADIRSIIDNGKPRHLRPILSVRAGLPHTSSHLSTVIPRALLARLVDEPGDSWKCNRYSYAFVSFSAIRPLFIAPRSFIR
jgi:hypothetical protein